MFGHSDLRQRTDARLHHAAVSDRMSKTPCVLSAKRQPAVRISARTCGLTLSPIRGFSHSIHRMLPTFLGEA